jgi:hypothetical protein
MIDDLYLNINSTLEAGADLVTTTAKLVSGEKGRKNAFANIRLTADKQYQLNRDLLKAKTTEERTQIINNALALIKSEEEKAINEYNKKSEINKRLFIVGAGLVLFISALLIKKIK